MFSNVPLSQEPDLRPRAPPRTPRPLVPRAAVLGAALSGRGPRSGAALWIGWALHQDHC